MSILIKGMEMPKDNCDAFREIIITNNFVDGKIQMLAHNLQTNEFIGEAVELPPHGRLIDADALKIEMIEQKLSGYVGHDWREVSQVIDDAPTIIEADDSFFNSLKRGLE